MKRFLFFLPFLLFAFLVLTVKTTFAASYVPLELTLTPTPTPKVMCWNGNYQYLYRNNSQAKKFCKCAQGTYGYKSYVSKTARATVYQYIDTGNNENWSATSSSSNLPVYQVTCTDSKAYPTNKDYDWPK